MATATVGYGVGARINLSPEDTYGTAADPADGVWLGMTSESLKMQRPSFKSGTLTGGLNVQQILPDRRSVAGDLSSEVDGSDFGYLFNFFNGNASGAYSVAAVPRISSAPTLTAASSGSKATGSYYGKVVAVYEKDSDGSRWSMGASAESSQVTLASTNHTINWAWTDPTTLTPPTGYTYAGTALYMTAVGGSPGTEVFMHFVEGTGNTYSDTGAGYLGAGSYGPPTGVMYEHTFNQAFTPGSNPLPPFTAHVIHDNNKAEQALGGRMTGFELAVSAGAEPVKSKFSMMFRDWKTVTNPSYSAISNVRKMMSWQSQISVGGTYTETIESYTVNGKMASTLVGGLSGKPRYRDVSYGLREYDVAFQRGFEDHQFVDLLNAGDPFAVTCLGAGQPFALNKSFVDNNGDTVYPFAYQVRFDLPALVLSEAGGNAGGPARIMEPIKAMAQTDATAGYDFRAKVWNMTATYAL